MAPPLPHTLLPDRWAARLVNRITGRGRFIEAIVARPLDDLTRLVFANGLDKHADATRAEYIRTAGAAATTRSGRLVGRTGWTERRHAAVRNRRQTKNETVGLTS